MSGARSTTAFRPRRLAAVARKEFIHVLRDPRALGIAIVLPMIMLLIFGYALTMDLDRVPLAVWDQSRTPQSRELVSRFEGSRYFSLVARPDSYREVEASLAGGRTMMAVVIPVEFGRRVASGRTTAVQVLADGSDANTTTLALSYAESVVRGYSQEILVERIRRLTGRPPALPLDLRFRSWFNTDMESRIFIVPGLIAVIMMLITALLTSLTVAREWETGTMEQLVSTPLRGTELILGKLVPYFTIGMLDMLLSVLAGRFLFGVPIRGSLVLLFLVSAIYLVGALSLGILISAKAKTQLLASQFAFVATFLPAFLLSGFMFDIRNMPKALQVLTYLIPARYFVAFLRGLYLKGTGLAQLWPECLLMVLFGALMLLAAIHSFRKRLD
ncbi:membrane protein [Geothrix rubra]|uniref:Membrane protein n=1 Tax=Geothrix rubra TaxID=2927977 RepID=A0ABQ5Q2C5_9BACT|nr:ABC transporter permease [Geothrix rubra]GLH68829.1 membrane protein [Geothrix rubra]